MEGGRGLAGNGRFDHRQAGLHARDERGEIRDHSLIDIVTVVGPLQRPAGRSILHDSLHTPTNEGR